MRREAETLPAPDGLRLHAVAWMPDAGPLRALILLVHGLTEHSGRYGHVAEFLTARGYGVLAVDYRAHGLSEGAPRGAFRDIESLVGDVRAAYEWARTRHPSLPMFLLGHSQGALLSLHFLQRHPGSVSGAVLIGAPLAIAHTTRPVMPLLSAINAVAPGLPILKLSAAKMSRDPAVCRAYDEDPLIFRGRLPANTFHNLIAATRQALDRLGEIAVPALILHGGNDRLVGPDGSEMLYRHIASPDKTLKIYPGLYHEILNEPERNVVLSDIAAWLDAHLP